MDQQQVAELLAALPIAAGGTSIEALPAIDEGHASSELCEAIRSFQMVQADLVADARVDVGGATWQRLAVLALPDHYRLGGVPLLLTATTLEVTELRNQQATCPALPTASGARSLSGLARESGWR